MKVREFCERLEREFGAPFLPEGFVRVVENKPGAGFALVIGDRDVQFDDDGDFVGSSSGVGDEAGWDVTRL